MILIIGIGNPLRADDGIGVFVVREIEALGLPHVEVRVTQQLHLEFLEDFLGYEKVILVDASCTDQEFQFFQVRPSDKEIIASSHHLSPEIFVNLAKKLHHQDLVLYVASIKGESFEVKEGLTDLALARAKKAVCFLKEFLV